MTIRLRGAVALLFLLIAVSAGWSGEEARPSGGPAIPVAPADPYRAAELRGEALRHRIRGEREAEIGSLRAALLALPGDGGAQFGLAVALAELGRDAEARSGFEALVDREPYRVVSLEHLAALDRAGGRTGDELERRGALAMDGRHDLAAVASLVAALRRAGSLTKALEPGPGSPGAAASDRAWDLVRQGLALQALGRDVQGRSAAIEALLLEPEDETIRRGVFRLARSREQLTEWETAVRRRARPSALETSGRSDDERSAMALAFVLEREGKAREARALLEAAARRRPERSSVHLALGELLASLGAQEDAVAELRRALEIDPGLVRGHVLLGRALLSQGAAAEAERAALAAIALSPQDGPSYVLLGRARLAMNRKEEALTAFRSALFLDPHDPSGEGRVGLYRCLGLFGREAEGPAFLTALLPPEADALAREKEAFLLEHHRPPRGLPDDRAGLRILSDGSVIHLETGTGKGEVQ